MSSYIIQCLDRPSIFLLGPRLQGDSDTHTYSTTNPIEHCVSPTSASSMIQTEKYRTEKKGKDPSIGLISCMWNVLFRPGLLPSHERYLQGTLLKPQGQRRAHAAVPGLSAADLFIIEAISYSVLFPSRIPWLGSTVGETVGSLTQLQAFDRPNLLNFCRVPYGDLATKWTPKRRGYVCFFLPVGRASHEARTCMLGWAGSGPGDIKYSYSTYWRCPTRQKQ